MNSSRKPFFAANFLISVAALIIVIAGLKAGKAFLVPFVFAFFLAMIGAGPLTFLNRWLPKPIAVLLVALGVVAIFAGIGIFLGSSVNAFSLNVPLYQDRLNEIMGELLVWLDQKGLRGTELFLSDSFQAGQLMDFLGVFLRGMVSALSSTLLVFIVLVFMLFEAAEFREKLKSVLVVLQGPFDMGRFAEISADVQRYLAMKTVTSGLTGLLAGTFVFVMGLEFAVLWGLIAFLLNYIPFVGSIVAAIPVVLLAIIQFGVGTAASMAVGYVIINIGISNFFEPVLMGRRLGLSPLVVFLSLTFWGWVWGPAGMLLSVPLTMVVKILLEHSDEFRWLALLMDSRPYNPANDASD